MKSVEKNQVRGCSPDTPTVCPSPHDDDDHLDDEDGEEPVLPVPIDDRVPSVERVLSELRGMVIVTTARGRTNAVDFLDTTINLREGSDSIRDGMRGGIRREAGHTAGREARRSRQGK